MTTVNTTPVLGALGNALLQRVGGGIGNNQLWRLLSDGRGVYDRDYWIRLLGWWVVFTARKKHLPIRRRGVPE